MAFLLNCIISPTNSCRLQRALNQEHRGPQPHAHFMRVSCQKINLKFYNHDPKPAVSEKPNKQPPIPVVVEPQSGPSIPPGTPKPPPSASDKENKDVSPNPEKQKKKSNAEKFAERHSKKPLRVGEGAKSPKPNKQGKATDRPSRSPGKIISKLSGGNSKIVLFVSHATFVTFTIADASRCLSCTTKPTRGELRWLMQSNMLRIRINQPLHKSTHPTAQQPMMR